MIDSGTSFFYLYVIMWASEKKLELLYRATSQLDFLPAQSTSFTFEDVARKLVLQGEWFNKKLNELDDKDRSNLPFEAFKEKKRVERSFMKAVREKSYLPKDWKWYGYDIALKNDDVILKTISIDRKIERQFKIKDNTFTDITPAAGQSANILLTIADLNRAVADVNLQATGQSPLDLTELNRTNANLNITLADMGITGLNRALPRVLRRAQVFDVAP